MVGKSKAFQRGGNVKKEAQDFGSLCPYHVYMPKKNVYNTHKLFPGETTMYVPYLEHT